MTARPEHPSATERPPRGPATWPMWAVIGLARLVIQLPIRWQQALGRGIGRLFYRYGRKRRAIARTNLELCFPSQPPERREQWLREHFEAAGMGVLEIAMAWWGRDAQLKGHYTIHGLEHLDKALEQGKGALLVSAHFTTLELCGRLLALHREFAAMYRPSERPLINYLFKVNRNHHTAGVIARDDVKGLLRTLRENMPVWYAPDQATSGRQTELVPFFGEPANTQTATHRIARVSGAPVLPFFGYRREDGHYVVTIHPPVEGFPTEDAHADTLRINHIIEEAVMDAPGQYFWTHKRFKKRAGLPDPYAP
ncbi:LpxL/LpxP family Kdo(2)-lipid IV(A) lauroyl/palmitoleoyl acyltransferase [Thioalkalivibrio sp. ALM2T]|uniref:LpxL/LpxP family Kdo(2)-lipid IV(A) lauroyl/palmitoleoyl acyltransferase n=1 Tax=Thioalkalivibrio sp. ALM2T TaxID=1158184 RepID=UPI0003A63DD4|nr:LpxL/LpxP family Kdo(2)-lipid IV(A) lauroyl/palmitoleoyl acyltransferase [Thioalkalivibrio sp. ALM2T]